MRPTANEGVGIIREISGAVDAFSGTLCSVSKQVQTVPDRRNHSKVPPLNLKSPKGRTDPAINGGVLETTGKTEVLLQINHQLSL